MNATTSALSNILLDPAFSIGDLSIVAFSIAILVWSSSLYRSCGNKEDRENQKNIRETIDGYSFRKTIVPLFEFLSKELTNQITSTPSDLPEVEDKKKFLESCDELRVVRLAKNDFSLVSGIPEVTAALEKVIGFKKMTDYYLRLSNWLLALGVIAAVVALTIVFMFKASIDASVLNILEVVWLILIVVWVFTCIQFHRIERRLNTLAQS